ncbi:unnamed protein product [Caenorhabditis nigoni]
MGVRHTALSPIIEKCASLARITAAISIHNEIYSKKSIVQEVTSEFLDISPSVAKELLEHDYGSLSNNMEKFYGSLSKIPAKLKNGDELIKIINLLLDMKENQDYLKPGKIGDQTEKFSKTAEIMKTSASQGLKILYTPYLKTAAETLRKVRESESQKMKTKDIIKDLSDLKDYLPAVGTQLNLMLTYKTVLKDYLSLKSLTNDLQNIENAARIAGEYSETINKLDPFRKDLIAASKDTNKIKEAIKEILKYSESIQLLFPKSILLNSTALKYDEKVITSGLVGYKDLNLIWKDFENPWFRENVLSNLDSTSLKEGLESLKPFVSALDSLIPSKRFDNKNEKKIILDLAGKINKVHEIGSKVKSFTSSKTPYEEVSACIEPLKPIQNPPDQDMLKRVVKFSGEVVENVKVFSDLMDDVNQNDLQSIITVSKEIKTNIELVTKKKNDTLKIAMWDTVRKLEKLHNLADKIQTVADQLNGLGKRNLFREDREVDYTVIQTVSTVFNGTNVDSVLNCIQRSSVDNLIGMLAFVDQSEILMNQKTEFKTATNYISNLLKIQKNYQEVITKMKNAKVPKESQALVDSNHFKDIGTNSKVIGRSVAALRALESISRSEKSIKSVVNLDSDAKIAIQKSLGPKSTDALIREMTLAQHSIGAISKVVKTKRIDSISDIQFTFISLSQLKNQTDIEDDNFLNLAIEMSNQTDPTLQSLSKDLLAVSNLDLRFVNHQKSLNVKNSLETTKDKLVNFLQSYNDGKDAASWIATVISSNSNYIVPILIASLVIGLIATGVICFICWYRGFGCWHFVESEDLESGNQGKTRKRKFGCRKNSRTKSKSKMSTPKRMATEFKDPKKDPKMEVRDPKKKVDDPKNPKKKHEISKEAAGGSTESKKRKDAMMEKLRETQQNLQKLRIHAKRCSDEQKSAARSAKFKKRGAIWIPNIPELPPPSPLPVVNIELSKVEWCEDLNEQWIIGSDIDDIQYSPTTEDEESTSSRKSRASKKSRNDGSTISEIPTPADSTASVSPAAPLRSESPTVAHLVAPPAPPTPSTPAPSKPEPPTPSLAGKQTKTKRV